MQNKDNNSGKFEITPEAKVGELLNHYPQLEDTLIAIAPVFKKLKNPVLRRTVARVTSLRQAARVGSVSLADMINRLRKEAGLSGEIEITQDEQSFGEKPDWVKNDAIAKTFDARKMIEEGRHPVNQVMENLKLLTNGQIFKLITSFMPAPLIDRAKKKGFLVWVEEEKKDLINTYFIRL